jgi:PAS domain S-box-containing protein
MDRQAGEWAKSHQEQLLQQWLEALRLSGEPFLSANRERLQGLLRIIFDEVVRAVMYNRFGDSLGVIEALRAQEFPVRYREFAGLLLTGRRITFDKAGEQAGADGASAIRILRTLDDAFVQLHLHCLDLWPGESIGIQSPADGAAFRARSTEVIASGPSSRANLFYNAFQYSTDGILITDLNGNIIEVNRAMLDLFGYTYNEVVGQTTRVFKSPHTTDAFYRNMWDIINRTGGWSGEIINRHKDGEEIPIFLSITPIFEAGRKVGFMGVEIDLRKQKKMEERLLQSERLAVIGQMAAKVAHEIRNPLSSISLNAELLQDELRDRTDAGALESKSLLDAIVSEVDRVALLTEEYLQFSRLPESRFNKDDLAEVLEEVADFLKPELDDTGVQLICEIDEQLPRLVFDRQQIRRALLNLLRNAHEAIPAQSGGVIKLSAVVEDAAVRIAVRDNGVGIAEEDLPHIFDPFFTTKDFGTGLGLALTQQIVNEHGGSIFCESKPDQGARFTILLPLVGPLTANAAEAELIEGATR